MDHDPEVSVVVTGAVPAGAVTRARAAIGKVGRHAPGRVLHAKVVLSRSADPAVVDGAHVDVALDVDGEVVRSHAARRDFDDAIHLAVDRLRRRIDDLGDRREPRRGPVRGRTS